MSMYIQTDDAKGKAEYLIKKFNAVEVPVDEWKTLDPLQHGLIVVVDNGPFEAAAYAYDAKEQERFSHNSWNDPRPRTYLLMDLDTVKKLAQ